MSKGEHSNAEQGTPTPTREHILRECKRYSAHRHILREASRDIHIPTILGTKKGIAALSDFLQDSGAFTKTGYPRAPRKPPEPYIEADIPDEETIENEEEEEEREREVEEEAGEAVRIHDRTRGDDEETENAQ
ncbi:hypothetical protein BD410DRAFT_780020 [Rickenella mellea]|uniref:Uncharacterized protein n=1 Tax=Rickenella mellea TaxID=50990 RepID=A0A4R5XEU3_9AGAM|nr:hypothetical protein BD410DRAFT_780020 [Rickenella mellea]